ncbi:hypothetical protein DFH28DRAFT_1215835 [Melampsora americana]|nr:hypothetical protein DFH28DRAFT_1215835 [Melampsora americana]
MTKQPNHQEDINSSSKPTSKDTIQSHHHLNQKINPNLTSLPFEIQEKIAYWVYWSHSHQSIDLLHQIAEKDDQLQDDDDQFEDVSDSDSHSIHHQWKPKNKNKILTNPQLDSGSTHDSDQFTLHSRESDDDDCLIDLRSLASVNRTFYQICCPYLYQSFDSQGFTVDKLKYTLEEIIKRHSNHVKKIWWRVSKSELMEFEDVWSEDSFDSPEWDPKLRSECLLQILKACPHLIDLDLDLDPKPIIPLTDSSDLDQQIPNLFIQPISQLTSLTHLSLTSPAERPPYTESFLVNILSNLLQLQSFSCSRIDATHPKPSKDQSTCQSPLGLHLAKLTELIELDFEKVQCLDSSWNLLDWKSSLKEITLEDCDRVSISVLHGFLKRFQSSLVSLALDNVPFHHDGTWTSDLILDDLNQDKFQFDLPNLINLEISNYLPIQFLKAFKPCKSITSISLDETPCYKPRDLEEFIQDRFWPNLKKLLITSRTAFLSPGEIEGLEVLCQGYGIEMSIDEDSDDDDDDDDDGADMEFDYDDEDLDEDDFEGHHWNHSGQDDDDEDDEDDDEDVE